MARGESEVSFLYSYKEELNTYEWLRKCFVELFFSFTAEVMLESSIHDNIFQVKCAACRQEYKNISVYYNISRVIRWFSFMGLLVSKLLVHVGFAVPSKYRIL